MMLEKILLIGLLVLGGCQSSISSGQLTNVPLPEEEKYDPEKGKEPVGLTAQQLAAYEHFVQKTSEALLNEQDGAENFVYSPMSFYLALAMLEPITFDDSLAELYQGLGHDNLHQVSEAFIKSITFNNEVGKGLIANSLWFEKEFDFNKDLLLEIANNYQAESFEVDFMDKVKVQNMMNNWVNKKTFNFIKDVDIQLNDGVALALINTLYFKDAWRESFSDSMTKQDYFEQADGQRVLVDFMNQFSSNDEYAENDAYQAVKKNLRNGGSMTFVLPKIKDETVSWDPSLEFEPTSIKLALPKFDLSATHDLIDPAKALGIELVFDPMTSAIYPFMDDGSVFISAISQQVRMAIDEQGVEAAAYTIIEMTPTSAHPTEPVEIVFDRPFMVQLEDVNGLVLFVGWVNVIE